MIDWINNKYGTNLTDNDLAEIKNFTLLWNIFDNTIFNTAFSIGLLDQEITNRNLQFAPFTNVLIYFQNRYTENGQTNFRFNHLNFRQNDREALVRAVLTNANNNDHDKILAIGIIVYRFRNNLFHGHKNFMEIGQQTENFLNANLFLRIFLDG